MPRRVIQVQGLGKRYRLGESAWGYETLREALTRSVRTLGRPRPPRRGWVWSLRDVGFEVEEGAALGLIGRNGAGKSTLLKILARITTPSTGSARVRGRVGSLLEVGTGFHPELTGHENIFLNGAILGMKRREVRRCYDRIVSFAEVEEFLDTPVKRYSSGMRLRLAFAVAAHLEPEVMVVDEVLAVGDAGFQRRCLRRLEEIAAGGTTLVFVSHDLESVQRLCPRSLWLDRGELQEDGPTGEVVARYLQSEGAPSHRRSFPDDGRCPVVLQEVAVEDAEGAPRAWLPRDRPFSLRARFSLRRPEPGLDVAFYLVNLRGVRVVDEALSDAQSGSLAGPGTYEVRVELGPHLAPGEYTVGIWFGGGGGSLLHFDAAASFVLEGRTRGRTDRVVHLAEHWDLRGLDATSTPGSTGEREDRR